MKTGTKQKILNAARTLFNEYGYNSVSLRDIAETVGISESNLTYHFKKKENLMESLLVEQEDTLPAGTPQTLEELDAIFVDQQQAVRNNLFFLHYTQLFVRLKETVHAESGEYRRYAWSVMYHLLTEKGQSELQSIIQV